MKTNIAVTIIMMKERKKKSLQTADVQDEETTADNQTKTPTRVHTRIDTCRQTKVCISDPFLPATVCTGPSCETQCNAAQSQPAPSQVSKHRTLARRRPSARSPTAIRPRRGEHSEHELLKNKHFSQLCLTCHNAGGIYLLPSGGKCYD